VPADGKASAQQWAPVGPSLLGYGRSGPAAAVGQHILVSVRGEPDKFRTEPCVSEEMSAARAILTSRGVSTAGQPK